MRLCQILLIWLILPNIGKSFLVSLCLLHVTVAKCSSIVRSIFYKQCTRFFMGNVEFDFLFMAFSSGCYNLQSRNRCVKNRPTAGRKNYDTQNFSNNFIPFSPCTIGRILPCIGSHLKIYTFLWLQWNIELRTRLEPVISWFLRTQNGSVISWSQLRNFVGRKKSVRKVLMWGFSLSERTHSGMVKLQELWTNFCFSICNLLIIAMFDLDETFRTKFAWYTFKNNKIFYR